MVAVRISLRPLRSPPSVIWTLVHLQRLRTRVLTPLSSANQAPRDSQQTINRDNPAFLCHKPPKKILMAMLSCRMEHSLLSVALQNRSSLCRHPPLVNYNPLLEVHNMSWRSTPCNWAKMCPHTNPH